MKTFACRLAGLGVVGALGCASGNWLHYSPDQSQTASPQDAGQVDPQTFKVLSSVEKQSAAGQHTDALAQIEDLQPLVQKRPLDRALVAQAKAYVLMTMGKNHEAIAPLQTAIESSALPDATRHDLRYNLVQIYVQQEQYEKAAPLLEHWIADSKQPEPSALALLGYIYHAQKRYDLAQDYLRRALSKDPTQTSWQQMLLSCYYEQEHYGQAKTVLLDLIAQDPLNQELWITLGQLEYLLDHPDQALVSLELAGDTKALSAEQIGQLARMYIVQKAPEPAVTLIKAAFKQGQLERDTQNLQLLAKAQLGARDFRGAYTTFQELAALQAPGKKLGELCLQLSSLAAHLEEDELAVEHSSCAIEHGQASVGASAQLLVGISRYRSRKFEESLRALRAAAASPSTRNAATQWIDLVNAQRENYRILHPQAEQKDPVAHDSGATQASAPNKEAR